MPAPFLKGYTPMDLIEKFWEEILSRDPLRIKAAFKPLCDREQNEVYNHLKRMSCDDGWHLEQKVSADAALDVIIHIIHPK